MASRLLVVLCALLSSVCGTALADPFVSIVNPYGGEFVPGTWVPLRLQVSNDTNAEINGSVDAEIPLADGQIQFTTKLTAPASSRSRTTIYAPLGAPEPTPKNKSAPPVATFVWNRDGGRLAQTDLLLRPAVEQGDTIARRSSFVAITGEDYPDSDAYDFFGISKQLSEISGSRIINWFVAGQQGAALHPVAYDSARIIAMGGVPPESLQPPQREALLAWVRAGGSLLVSAPTGSADVRGTWLAPYLPVRPIGQRLTDSIAPTETGKLPLRLSVPICEALPAPGGIVLLQDENYVHAAYKPLGLGRVAFTSFPPSAIADGKDAAMRQPWIDLLDLQATDPSWASTALPDKSPEFLREMIGAPAPARSIAVALAAGFVGLVVLMQLFWRGARRPMAFAAVAIAAIGGSAALVGIGLAAQSTAPLTAGRVALMNLSGNGGMIQEAVAFTGDQPDLSLSTGSTPATLRPLAFDSSSPPTLSVNPFNAPDAGAAARRIDRVWQADAATPADMTASATGVFDATGLRLSVKNAAGAPLVSPVLLHGTSVYRLSSLPVGESQLSVTGDLLNPVTAGSSNPGTQDAAAAAEAERQRAMKYLNGGPILTELDQLRATMLAASFARPTNTTGGPQSRPVTTNIAGWIDSPSAASLIKPSTDPQVTRSLVLAMLPVTLQPSPAGSPIAVDRGFNTLVTGAIAIPVYDTATGTWLASGQPGEWQIGFRPPQAIGKLRPTRVTLNGNVSLPAHTLTLLRGQVRDGKPELNPAGQPVVEWKNTFGPQPDLSFDVTPADYDANGTVWFYLRIETPPPTGGVMPLWSINELGADIEGRVE